MSHLQQFSSCGAAVWGMSDVRRQKLYTGLDRPWGFLDVEAPRFQDNRHMQVIRLSALRTGHLYPPGNIPGTHFCYRLCRHQGHSTAGSIMSTKISNDTIWNRTRDLPACSTLPQLTETPRDPLIRRGCCISQAQLRIFAHKTAAKSLLNTCKIVQYHVPIWRTTPCTKTFNSCSSP